MYTTDYRVGDIIFLSLNDLRMLAQEYEMMQSPSSISYSSIQTGIRYFSDYPIKGVVIDIDENYYRIRVLSPAYKVHPYYKPEKLFIEVKYPVGFLYKSPYEIEIKLHVFETYTKLKLITELSSYEQYS